MINLNLNIGGTFDFITQNEIELFENEISFHFKQIKDRKDKGSKLTGWATLPGDTSHDFLDKIIKDAERITQNSEVLVVSGIGGSYLGTRAVIEALDDHFHLKPGNNNKPEVVYAGHNLSEDYLFELLKWLNDKEYSIVVISKSGTTTETALSFRLLKNHIENKYGKRKAKGRIVAITDARKGSLHKLAEKEGYTTYAIPADIGGRYSVLTPVGLFPIAAAGYDIKQIIAGARNMQNFLFNTSALFENPAFLYAAVRNILYNKGKGVEILAYYLPNLFFLAEWWKQLFGESEGKENKGILPVSANFTTDLHSLGQYIQQGKRILFETVLSIDKNKNQLKIPDDADNYDGLNYLAGKNVGFINSMAEKATTLAHIEGGVPVIRISVPGLNEKILGELLYFFQMSCAISGYVLDVNPFDQPGVEDYKKNMFALLGKPGYQNRIKEINNKLKRQ